MASNQGVNRIISSTLTLVAGVSGLASFDTPAIIGNSTPVSGYSGVRAKIYAITDAAQVKTDWGSGSPEYAAFLQMASQSPTVKNVVILKSDAYTAQTKTITWSGNFASGDVISGTINGDAFSVPFNTDQATTMGDLNAALAAAFGVATSTGTSNVNTVTSDPGYMLNISISASGGAAPTATIATTAAGRTIQDDIQEAQLEPGTSIWYALAYVGTNEGAMYSGAAYAESQNMIFCVQSNSATIKTSATTDIMSRLFAAGYRRTFGTYRETLTDYVNSSLIARVLAADPGSITFWHRNLAGVTPDNLTTSELGYIEGKNTNNYAPIAGKGRFEPGVSFDGNSIQLTRDLDYMMNEVTEELHALLVNRDKTPFNASGQVLIESTMTGTLERLVSEGVLEPGYTLTIPDPADVDPSDKAAHKWSGITINGDYSDGVRTISFSATINV